MHALLQIMRLLLVKLYCKLQVIPKNGFLQIDKKNVILLTRLDQQR